MGAAPQPDRFKMTPDEYAAFEAVSETKHEYVGGYVVSRAGATPRHNRIAAGLLSALVVSLRGTECAAMPSDMRVAVPNGNYRYPDATVVCGEGTFEKRQGLQTLLDPILLAEVLSQSTRETDLGIKVWEYQRIASLNDYLIIDQEQALVLHHSRVPEGWLSREITGLGASVALLKLAITLTLADIYAQVRFDDAAS